MTYAHVALASAGEGTYTYRVPDGMVAAPGARVLVPLGPRTMAGIVVETMDEPDIDPALLKDIKRLVDDEPPLPPLMLELARFIADYYACPFGEVLRTVAPGGPVVTRRVQLTEAGRATDPASIRGERRQAILRALATASLPLATTALSRRAGAGAAAAVAGLVRDGLVEMVSTLATTREKDVATWRLGPGTPLVAAPIGAATIGAAILQRLAELEEAATIDDLALALGRPPHSLRSALSKLEKQGRIVRERRVVLRSPHAPRRAGSRARAIVLSKEQEAALVAVAPAIDGPAFAVTLIQGVTGSGKTEVYLRAIERAIAGGRSALYLVPEISITPLLLRNVRERFGERTAVLHSGLSDGERHDERLRIRDGHVDVVVGARSAVFAPLPNLGLVVVDEEHDSSYKQDSQPRYHGRDVAIVRARLEGVPVVLGSATPSLESARNAETGRYGRVVLRERAGGSVPAVVELVDMRAEWRATRSPHPVSRRLREALGRTLADGRQALILINRRGWADFVLCRECGEAERCEHCAVTLTVHLAARALTCHYCDFHRDIPVACRHCGGSFLQNVGAGTEQLERELEKLMPGAGIARLDADVARLKGEAARVLADFEAGRTRVLVGTQMIAKGHDFPGVTLVGVLQADRSLWLPDFRAGERTFQLLTQVAGRAGRREHEGLVIIQTFTPEHPSIALAATQDFDRFYAAEAPLREALAYPPFTRIVSLLVSGPDRDEAEAHAARWAHRLREIAPQAARILGPAPAPLMRLEDRWRFQVLVKAPDRSVSHPPIRRVLAEIPARDPLRVDVDVDPQSLL